ncbi:MAG: 3-hydroxyacyl-CoA dehydrogenase NAD-binding domain-containing protein [Pseudomonadota bacterium]
MAIESVAVLGAGVMGAGIAAQIANAGVDVLLLDVPQGSGESRNARAEAAIARMVRTEPKPLMHRRNARRIKAGNLEDDLAAAAQRDWVVEAVVERLDVKQALYARLEESGHALVSSNTSTIPLSALTHGRSSEFKSRFAITHFFNPPRYMRLMELVRGAETAPETATALQLFCDQRLGKGVVDCKDTPGFIANRIGTYWLQSAMSGAMQLGVDIESADAVLGRPFGIPKTGVFGLIDLVGLDLMPQINASMRALLPADDPMFGGRTADEDVPPVVARLIEDGFTGRKGKGGFYRLDRSDGERRRLVLDLNSGAYGDIRRPRVPAAAAARKGGPQAVMAHDSPAGELAWRVMSGTINYAASLLGQIADTPGAVDRAMQLGYGWGEGPFALLDRLGVDWFIAESARRQQTVAEYIQSLAGTSVYAGAGACATETLPDGVKAPRKRPAGVVALSDIKAGSKPVGRNGSASLWDVGEGVLCAEFHSKMNAIEPGTLAMLQRALQEVPKQFQALVIHNEADNFSVGANVGLLLFAANMAAWQQIDASIAGGQQTYRALKYAPFPVVGAPSGMALGGGCEVLLHCDAVQAHAETYMGLVEVGVGIVPGWGGCKELLLRWYQEPRRPQGPMPAVSKVFEFISTAKVATSAAEAMEMKLLLPRDAITMNRERVLADARSRAVALAENYTPPTEPDPIPLPGETARVALQLAVDGFVKLGRATAHDQVVAAELAHILSGGPTDITATVTEQDIYDLEREALVRLARTGGTLARLEHMLETGKPLRN